MNALILNFWGLVIGFAGILRRFAANRQKSLFRKIARKRVMENMGERLARTETKDAKFAYLQELADELQCTIVPPRKPNTFFPQKWESQ